MPSVNSVTAGRSSTPPAAASIWAANTAGKDLAGMISSVPARMAAQAAAMRRRGRTRSVDNGAGRPAQAQRADAHQRRDEPDPRRGPSSRLGEPRSQEGTEAALDVTGEDVDERMVRGGEHGLRPVCHASGRRRRSPRLVREEGHQRRSNNLKPFRVGRVARDRR